MKWIETEYKQMNKYYEDVLSTMTAIKTSKMRMKQRQNVLKKRIKWVLQNCDIKTKENVIKKYKNKVHKKKRKDAQRKKKFHGIKRAESRPSVDTKNRNLQIQ
eukprot:901080_1